MRCFDFDRALVRHPSLSVVDGLRAHDGPGPTFAGILAEHAAYAAALAEAGVAVERLDAVVDHPDAIFVEDPALVFTEGAIMLRPGAPSRRGEAALLRGALAERFGRIETVTVGQIDGGDILATPDRVLIGLSDRTDRAGAEALARLLEDFGRTARIVDPPRIALHLKTQASLADEETMVVTPAAAASGLFEGFRLIVVDPAELPAANVLRINERLIVSGQHRRTADRLAQAGYDLIAVDTSHIERIDAGLTCLSLRWKA
jgi:dimethylargininase